MAKETGYTYEIATSEPADTFVFCKWFTTQQKAIDYAVGELTARSQYVVEFILIREGITNSDDPIIWDSRKNYVPTPMQSPIRLKIEELYNQNNFDTDTFNELINVLDLMEKNQ